MLLPLAAPGLFVAVILVYIPLFTDFATPGLVGGTSSYMLGNSVADLMVTIGDWGGGAALSLLLLVAMAVDLGARLLSYQTQPARLMAHEAEVRRRPYE